MERRFAEQDAKLAEQDLKIERMFAEQNSKFDRRFTEQDAKFDARFNNLERDLGSLKSVARINTAIMFLLLANVALPALSKFLS
jgi:hypothetical protein